MQGTGFPTIAHSVQEQPSCALRLVAGAAMIPHLEKVRPLGVQSVTQAYFVKWHPPCQVWKALSCWLAWLVKPNTGVFSVKQRQCWLLVVGHVVLCPAPHCLPLTAYHSPLTPHPLHIQAEKGGEDAYCIIPVGLGSIGVADGVSGWAEEGIDPAEYSRTLMRYVFLVKFL